MPKVAGALVDAGRTAVRFDRSNITFDSGFRAAVGISVPLVIGQASGHPTAGVTAAIGALTAGLASLQGAYRSRAGVIVAATSVMAGSAFIGATVGHLLGVDIVVTGVLGFGAGLLVCLGQSALVVGVQAIVGLVVFSQVTLSPLVVLRNAGLILAGGAVQMLLVVALWPLRRYPVERRALRDAFAALARYCRAATSGTPVLVDQSAFERLDAVLADPQPFGGDEVLAHRALASQAERLRLELVALARTRARLAAAGRQDAGAAVGALLDTTAHMLDDVAAAIGDGRIPMGWTGARDSFEQALEDLRGHIADQEVGGGGAEAPRRANALAGQSGPCCGWRPCRQAEISRCWKWRR